MISSAVYSGVLRRCLPSYYNAREIKREEYVRLVLVSLLFIVNIVLGNVSIKYCSLALDQVAAVVVALRSRLCDVLCQRGRLSFSTFYSERSYPGECI